MLGAIKRLEAHYEKVDDALFVAEMRGDHLRAVSLQRTKRSLSRQILALYDAAQR